MPDDHLPNTQSNPYAPPATRAGPRATISGWNSTIHIAIRWSILVLLGLFALGLFVTWVLPALFGIELVGIGPP